MKIFSLFALIFTAFSLTAQISIVDFEDDGLNPPKPDCIATAEWLGDSNAPVVTWESNPSPAGVNVTPNCVKFVETTGSAAGNSLQFAFNNSTAKTGHNLTANKYVTLMVYSENQTVFDILLELGTGGTPNFFQTQTVNTALNTWTKVEFDFSDTDISNWNSNIRIHFNNGSAGSGDTYYVDEYYIAPTSSVGPFTPPAALSRYVPEFMDYTVAGGLLQEMDLQVSTAGNYATVTLYANDVVIADNLDVPASGTIYSHNQLVKFPQAGDVQLKLEAVGSDVVIESLSFSNYSGVTFPDFFDATGGAGIVDETSLKYGGPSIADINNDGSYDLILNNHNDSPSKLYMCEGDGTFTKQVPDLSLYNLMDLHGSATGDFDNDGDQDIVIALGGGNGSNPTTPVFYRNDGGTLNRVDDQIGITSGARGRSPRFSDMDADGDLDLMLINAAGINGAGGAQHIFYENNGDGTFSVKSVAGLENAPGEKLLLTDIDNDQVDDVIMLSPLSVWRGNGDFTYTDVSSAWLPSGLVGNYGTVGATDIDVDNDGDLDLYLARGEYYFTIADNNTVDFFPLDNKADLRLSGSQGVLPFTVNAGGSITLSRFDFVKRNAYNGGFPVFLGSAMQSNTLADFNSTLEITQAAADGWPASRTQNGLYVGYVGNGLWQLELVKNADIYWSIHYTIDGITTLNPTGWTPNNANQQDIFLLNNGSSFSNASTAYNIPTGGNHWGVTRGDFNNDGYDDLYVYRMGFLKNRLSDYLMMNTGAGSFEVTTAHTAHNRGADNHGDMGQAFDYNSDGNVDIFNGDDEYGVWLMYENTGNNHNNNYLIVDVGYSPVSNIDPMSAQVVVNTPVGGHLGRVRSAGETHSQSLLNLVHFGLGSATEVTSITVIWRNGETITITDEAVNQVVSTSAVLPVELLSFKGFATEKGNRLEWQTASEQNNDRFAVERSADSRDFIEIGSKKGKGTTDVRHSYTFLDENPPAGENYYRLRQVDYDGNFSYSKIIRLYTKAAGTRIGEFHPNPTAGFVNLNYQTPTSGEIQMSVFNTAGQLVEQRIIRLEAGQNELTFDFSDLAKGTYSVQIGETETTVRQLIIH